MSEHAQTGSLSQSLLDIFVAPSQAIARINQTGAHGWLLLVQMLCFTAVMYWFYAGMSPEWLIDQQLLMAGDLSPAEAEQMRSMLAQSTGYIGIVGALYHDAGDDRDYSGLPAFGDAAQWRFCL